MLENTFFYINNIRIYFVFYLMPYSPVVCGKVYQQPMHDNQAKEIQQSHGLEATLCQLRYLGRALAKDKSEPH